MSINVTIVEIAGLIADGFNKPASCQLFIKHSPMVRFLSVLVVIAIITISGEVLLYWLELIITAGRFLVAV